MEFHDAAFKNVNKNVPFVSNVKSFNDKNIYIYYLTYSQHRSGINVQILYLISETLTQTQVY